jgi:hypothetical protein
VLKGRNAMEGLNRLEIENQLVVSYLAGKGRQCCC